MFYTASFIFLQFQFGNIWTICTRQPKHPAGHRFIYMTRE